MWEWNSMIDTTCWFRQIKKNSEVPYLASVAYPCSCPVSDSMKYKSQLKYFNYKMLLYLHLLEVIRLFYFRIMFLVFNNFARLSMQLYTTSHN